MGLLSSIAGGLLGGIFQKKSEKRQNAYAVENTLKSLPRLRQSAEDAGFNPLTALLAGGGGGFNAGAPNVAPLASASVIQGVVQDASDKFTGEDQEQKARQKVRDDIERLQLERLAAGGAKTITTRTSEANTLPNLTASSPAKLGATQTSVAPQTRSVRPPKLSKDPAKPVEPNQVHVREDYTTDIGEKVGVYMGPEWDELISGAAINSIGTIKDMRKRSKVNTLRNNEAREKQENTVIRNKAASNIKPLGGGNSLPSGDWSHLTNKQLKQLATDYQKVKGTSKEKSLRKYYKGLKN
ncbi:MAG: hypothetical protein ABJN39_20240 [Sulfitobacter sp.]|uniref:hypothetical protein n=1 Tax=Sulfitobacter sp. TaxID=1903071 RepID=UPI0032998F6E